MGGGARKSDQEREDAANHEEESNSNVTSTEPRDEGTSTDQRDEETSTEEIGGDETKRKRGGNESSKLELEDTEATPGAGPSEMMLTIGLMISVKIAKLS